MLKEKNNYDYMDERLPDDGGRSLEDIVSAVGEQELAEVPHVPMTPERLAALAAACEVTDENLAAPTPNNGAVDKEKKRRRMYKLVGGIAALFVLVLVGAVIAFNALSVDVGADKNQKEEIVTEDGVVIEDGGYGASDNTDGNIWGTEAWGDIDTAKELYPQLMIPKYIPKGYEFEQLIIEQVETGTFSCFYSFFSKSQETLEIEVFILEDSLVSTDVNDVARKVNCAKGSIYIREDDIKIATIQCNDGISISIRSNLSDNEIIEIVNNFND